VANGMPGGIASCTRGAETGGMHLIGIDGLEPRNSNHCRHWDFNAVVEIDGVTEFKTLFPDGEGAVGCKSIELSVGVLRRQLGDSRPTGANTSTQPA